MFTHKVFWSYHSTLLLKHTESDVSSSKYIPQAMPLSRHRCSYFNIVLATDDGMACFCLKYFRCFHTNSFCGNKLLKFLMPVGLFPGSLTLFSCGCFLPRSQSWEGLALDSSVIPSVPSVSCLLEMKLLCPSAPSLLLFFWVPKAAYLVCKTANSRHLWSFAFLDAQTHTQLV